MLLYSSIDVERLAREKRKEELEGRKEERERREESMLREELERGEGERGEEDLNIGRVWV